MEAVKQIGEDVYTERDMIYSRKIQVFCPYYFRVVGVESRRGCFKKGSPGCCRFLSSVKMGKIICKWKAADGHAADNADHIRLVGIRP